MPIASSVRVIDRGLNALLSRLRQAKRNNPVAVVGVFGEKASEDHEGGKTVGEIAAIHEFGIGVPRRSWLRDYVTIKKDKNRQRMKQIAKMLVISRNSLSNMLEQFGLTVVGEIQERIASGIDPELKYRRGTPLILTGQFRSSISHKVEQT